MKKIAFYMHSGSDNRGCEAIVRATKDVFVGYDISVFSLDPDADRRMRLEEICDVQAEGETFIPHSLKHIWLKLKEIFCRNEDAISEYRFQNIINQIKDYDWWFSIGGDNYCGYGLNEKLNYLNKKIHKNGKKTVLWGCSIEPDEMKKKQFIEDASRYDLIVVRESLTKAALAEVGVKTTIVQMPDPAFMLQLEETELPDNFVKGNTIGINVSPLIQKRGGSVELVYESYKSLVEYILNNMDSNVVFIPHVVKDNSNDLIPLTRLYEEFKRTGRVMLVNKEKEWNCMKLKYLISQCRMIVTARTHVSIAAYSTGVPTLVIGYSIKARGIAQDIFGDYHNYVLPVQELERKEQLVNAFLWIKLHEDSIKSYLSKFIPQYIENINRYEVERQL